MSPRARAIVLALAIYSAATTLALVWLLGRASVAPIPSRPASPPPETAISPAPEPVSQAPAPATPKPQYPLFQSAVPSAFRGAWDEIVSDKCQGREARFYFGERTFTNFEVEWEVTKVKLYSPTEIDLYTTAYDENKNQVDEIWEFKLVDRGRSLTGRKPGALFFKKCPKA